MKASAKLLAGSIAALSLAALAPAASAAIYILPWTNLPDGGITLNFGDNGIASADQTSPVYEVSPTTGHLATAADGTGTHTTSGGEFTDTFMFTLPAGTVAFSLTSIGLSASADTFLDSASFNGAALTISNSPLPAVPGPGTIPGTNFAMGFDGPQPVTSGGMQTLVITGHGGADASYGGVGTFSPAVPEPATWGLMLVGFGGMGALLRNNRRRMAAVAA